MSSTAELDAQIAALTAQREALARDQEQINQFWDSLNPELITYNLRRRFINEDGDEVNPFTAYITLDGRLIEFITELNSPSGVDVTVDTLRRIDIGDLSVTEVFDYLASRENGELSDLPINFGAFFVHEILAAQPRTGKTRIHQTAEAVINHPEYPSPSEGDAGEDATVEFIPTTAQDLLDAEIGLLPTSVARIFTLL